MDLSGDKGAGKQRAHATAAVFLRLRLSLARLCPVSSVSSFMLLLSFCIYFLNKIILPDFGLWSVRVPLVLVRTGRRLPVQALCERRVLVALTGYPRGGAPGPG